MPVEKNINKDIKFAFAYIRVSTEDQTEYSPDAQKAAILKYAAANGYIIRDQDFYIDAGISGRTAEKRPAFMEMIARAKGKDRPCDVILVHKFDRFARSREDSIVYKSLLKKECGVRVISITESIEDDKFSIILEAMLEAMAEYYSINLSEEVKKGMTEKHQRGEMQTAPPFGYHAKNGALIPDPVESKIVQDIFLKFTSGVGCMAIAKSLNQAGIRTHRKNRFENRTVEYILRNPVYIGKLRWNPSRRTRRNYNDPDIVIVSGKHDAIIGQEMWEAAQVVLNKQKAQWKYHGRPIESMVDWISGIVSCSECGCSLISAGRYWKCNGYAKGACAYSQHVSGDILKAAIIKKLETDFESKQILDFKIVQSIRQEQSEQEALNTAIGKVQSKLSRLRDAFLAGAESVEDYKRIKSALEKEKSDLEKQMNQFEISNTQEDNQLAIRSAIRGTIEILLSNESTKEEKHSALKSVVESCVFDKRENSLSIFYRLAI